MKIPPTYFKLSIFPEKSYKNEILIFLLPQFMRGTPLSETTPLINNLKIFEKTEVKIQKKSNLE
jgi:hypothetical protein